MSSLVTINGRELTMKYHEGQPVLTLSEVDQIHEKNGSAKRNFNYHADRFLEGIDYYTMTVREFREGFKPGYTSNRGNPDLRVVLLTESGYMLLAKTFNDDLAWDIQRALVQNYFRVRENTPDIYMYLREVLNLVESQDKKLDLQEVRILEMDERMRTIAAQVEAQKAIATPAQDYYSSTMVAVKLKLFAVRSQSPHTMLVNAIAYQAGIAVNQKRNYEDEFVKVQETLVNPEKEIYAYTIAYTKQGFRRILDWLNDNEKYAYFESFYKNNGKYGKAGDLKNRGYRVGKTSYYVD